jgi:DNA-binding transcriptional ArsR family regulator
MAPSTKIAPELVRAMAHPQRFAILSALDKEAMTVSTLQRELQLARPVLLRHLRALERVGFIHGADIGSDRLYEVAAIPRFEDAEWGTLSTVAQREGVASMLAHLHVASTTALDAGGFDRDDMHFTRTALRIGEKDFKRLAAEFADLMYRVEDVQEHATEGEVGATAVLMLFESEVKDHRPSTTPDEGEDAFTTLEGRERVYDLQERIADLVVEADLDWDAALNVVDELRVVLKASKLAAEREQETHREGHATPAT